MTSAPIPASPREAPIGALVVFSDDWGRHPSSSQHLVARLPGDYPIVWVNTIGTRGLRLDLRTLRRVVEKLGQWLRPGAVRPSGDTFGTDPSADPPMRASASTDGAADARLPAGAGPGGAPPAASGIPAPAPGRLRVVAPAMWPGFGRRWMRTLNAWLLARRLRPLVAALPAPVVVLTTLPLVADLPARLPAACWLYYCVDDFGAWPGYDGPTLSRMERDLAGVVDGAVAVSETLVAHLAGLGLRAACLTHGVDPQHWRHGGPLRTPAGLPADGLPIVCFWGVIDRRLDMDFLRALVQALDGRAHLVLIGPREDPDPALASLPGIRLLPPMPLAVLPAVARAARVLVMPYVDAPVTRAMQPLKLKEYLSTGRAVVVRDLPATRPWAQACDVHRDAAGFAAAVLRHIECDDLPQAQQRAREALADETWQSKAEWLADWMAAFTRRPAPDSGGISRRR